MRGLHNLILNTTYNNVDWKLVNNTIKSIQNDIVEAFNKNDHDKVTELQNKLNLYMENTLKW